MLLANMTQPEAEEALRRGSVVLVTGSIEQHGGHLPLGTDAFAALTIASASGSGCRHPSSRHSARRGSLPPRLAGDALSVRPETLVALMVDVCEGLAGAGVERVVVVNWHEGNSTAIRLGADRAQQQFPLRVVVAESHVITNALFPDEMEFTHGGSMETAAILAHDPGLVRLDQRVEGDPVDRASEGHALFRRRDVFPILSDFRKWRRRGGMGHRIRSAKSAPGRSSTPPPSTSSARWRRCGRPWRSGPGGGGP